MGESESGSDSLVCCLRVVEQPASTNLIYGGFDVGRLDKLL